MEESARSARFLPLTGAADTLAKMKASVDDYPYQLRSNGSRKSHSYGVLRLSLMYHENNDMACAECHLSMDLSCRMRNGISSLSRKIRDRSK